MTLAPMRFTIAQLPTFGHGDTVELKCTYDNSLANPFTCSSANNLSTRCASCSSA